MQIEIANWDETISPPIFRYFQLSSSLFSLSMFTKSLGPCINLELASCILNFAFFTLHLHFGSDCLTIVEVHYLIVKMKATYWAHSGAIGSSEVFLVICHPYLISEDCLGAHFVLISWVKVFLLVKFRISQVAHLTFMLQFHKARKFKLCIFFCP